MHIIFYARMRKGQNKEHQEKGRHRLNIFNNRDEYYYYYYYYDIRLCILNGEPLEGLGSELSQYARIFPPAVIGDMSIHNPR